MQKFFNDKMEEMLEAQKKEREAKSDVGENDADIPNVFVTGMTIDGDGSDIDAGSITTVTETNSDSENNMYEMVGDE